MFPHISNLVADTVRLLLFSVGGCPSVSWQARLRNSVIQQALFLVSVYCLQGHYSHLEELPQVAMDNSNLNHTKFLISFLVFKHFFSIVTM